MDKESHTKSYLYPMEHRSLWEVCPIRFVPIFMLFVLLTGKLVDMATPYGKPIPGKESNFTSIRDSFYSLMNLNQYQMKFVISMTEAEGLLWIILFSKDLKLLSTK